MLTLLQCMSIVSDRANRVVLSLWLSSNMIVYLCMLGISLNV